MWGDTEPIFVNLLRSPGIDSQPGGSVRQPYVLYLPARLHRLAESISRNRFQSSMKVYKYGLRGPHLWVITSKIRGTARNTTPKVVTAWIVLQFKLNFLQPLLPFWPLVSHLHRPVCWIPRSGCRCHTGCTNGSTAGSAGRSSQNAGCNSCERNSGGRWRDEEPARYECMKIKTIFHGN